MTLTYKPWGYYQNLTRGHNYKVKELHISPGEKLSLQYHLHRDEVWYVVGGTGLLYCGDTNRILSYGTSALIEKGQQHSVECNSNEELIIIELQLGSYLEEEDIVRIEDKYGRK